MKQKSFKLMALFAGQFLVVFSLLSAVGADFVIRQVAIPELVNRSPKVGETGIVVWQGGKRSATESAADIYVLKPGEAVPTVITQGKLDPISASARPQISGSNIVFHTTFLHYESKERNFVLEDVPIIDSPIGEVPDGIDISILKTNTFGFPISPGGNNEIMLWKGGGELERITKDDRNDFGPAISGNLMAWQKARGWPFGWEIMLYENGNFLQLTTNFFYDMAPVVDGNEVAWYGWDGNDFEIFYYNHTDKRIVQITSNQFDDVSPVISDGLVAWEAYPVVEADIFIWKDQKVEKLSSNVEDDLNPSTWNGQVVWQGYDGDDYEIYYFDGRNTIKLTSNLYDDINPYINDGTIVWIGYHDNWDAEVFSWSNESVTQLSTNNYDDRGPHTSNGRVVWYADDNTNSYIFVAEPKPAGNN